LNGLLYGVMLFLLAAGLTLIFGIMGVINLAHGSLYMIGAFIGTWVAVQTGNFWLGLPAAILAATIAGIVIELGIMRKLYQRDHLDQVLATFSLILIFNELTVLIFGRQPIFTQLPASLSQPIELFSGLSYPPFRLLIIVTGLLGRWRVFICSSTAPASVCWSEQVRPTVIWCVRSAWISVCSILWCFALGAAFAGLAGFMTGPILAVQVGMGEQILLATFVVVVIGGVGSIKGAFIAGISLGIIDTCLRAFLPSILRHFMAGAEADALGVGIASMGIYLLMAIVLLFRPRGLFPVGA
jgi:branched-chain amino acid transport system permease protein